MWKEAIEITVACVLAIQMGLIDAISHLIHYEFRILSCPRCSVFWISLGWHLFHGHGVLEVTFVSFLSSYAALWLSLLYDAIALGYNYVYEKIQLAAKDEPRSDAVS